MTDHPRPPEGEDMTDSDNPTDTSGGSDWAALDILRSRARAAAERRDASIAELRQEIDDANVLDEFGIDLSRLED